LLIAEEQNRSQTTRTTPPPPPPKTSLPPHANLFKQITQLAPNLKKVQKDDQRMKPKPKTNGLYEALVSGVTARRVNMRIDQNDESEDSDDESEDSDDESEDSDELRGGSKINQRRMKNYQKKTSKIRKSSKRAVDKYRTKLI